MIAPQVLEAEQAALGSALISETACRLLVTGLECADYYHQAHRYIHEAIVRLVGRAEPADLVAVPDELTRMAALEAVGGARYLMTLTESVPTAAHAGHYVDLVKGAAIKRGLIAAGETIVRTAGGTETAPDDAIEAARATLDAVSARRVRGPSLLDAAGLLRTDFQPPKWAVPDLIPTGLTLLVARPKVGKSWLALQIGLAIAQGGVALGSLPVTPGNVLGLFLEDQPRRLKNRLEQLLGDGTGMDGGRLQFATECPRMDEGGRAWLENTLRANPGIRLVVVDTLERFRQRRDNRANAYGDDYEALGSIKAIADRADVAIMVIHHERKFSRNEDILDAVSGSMGVTGAADSILILRRQRGESVAKLFVTGRDVDERDLALSWSPHSAWTLEGDAAAYTKSAEERQIIECLQSLRRSASPAEVAQLIGVSRQAAKMRMWRLANRGVLIAADGVYTLPIAGTGETAETPLPCTGNSGNAGNSGTGWFAEH